MTSLMGAAPKKSLSTQGSSYEQIFSVKPEDFALFFSSVFVVDKNGVDYAAQSCQYSGLRT